MKFTKKAVVVTFGLIGLAGFANAADYNEGFASMFYDSSVYNYTEVTKHNGGPDGGKDISKLVVAYQANLDKDTKPHVQSRNSVLDIRIDPSIYGWMAYGVDHKDNGKGTKARALFEDILADFSATSKTMSKDNGFYLWNGEERYDFSFDRFTSYYGYTYTFGSQLNYYDKDNIRADRDFHNYIRGRMKQGASDQEGSYDRTQNGIAIVGVTSGGKSSDVEAVIASYDVVNIAPRRGDKVCIAQVAEKNSGHPDLAFICAEYKMSNPSGWAPTAIDILPFTVKASVAETIAKEDNNGGIGTNYLANGVIQLIAK